MMFLIMIPIFWKTAFALGVPAGTKIENIAYLNYKVEDQNYTASSNRLVDVVDQKLDMKIVCQESANIIVGTNEVKRALAFRLVNKGNGVDGYQLSPISSENSDFEVLNPEIYLDDGDHIFSLAKDSLVQDINLSADANSTLFFVSDIPHDADKLSINGIKAHSQKQQNLLYGESRNMGEYAVLVAMREEASLAHCTYEVSHLALELEKRATLSSDALYHRSTIHYQIAVKVSGIGEISNVMVQDKIPEGTIYVANSLRLDGVGIENDANATEISVDIGTIIQKKESDEPKHLISFDVKVK